MSGFVYAANFGDETKIGHTVDVRARMRDHRAVQTCSVELLSYTAGTRGDELALHNLLGVYRTAPEFFCLPDEVKQDVVDALEKNALRELISNPPPEHWTSVGRHGAKRRNLSGWRHSSSKMCVTIDALGRGDAEN